MQVEQLTAGHGALTAVRTGAGPDLVILHSLLADRHAFDPVLPALSAKFRVTLINLPGFHGSQPAVLPLMDAYVAAIEDGFGEFGVAKDAVLIGNGFGGTVALAFAIAHPERISKLVLSDAAAAFPPEGRQAFAVMAQKVADSGLGAVAEIAAKRVYSPDYLEGPSGEDRGAQKRAARHPPRCLSGRLPHLAGERPGAAVVPPARADACSSAARWIRRPRPRSTSRSPTRSTARAMSNCPAAATARRWNSRRSS